MLVEEVGFTLAGRYTAIAIGESRNGGMFVVQFLYQFPEVLQVRGIEVTKEFFFAFTN